MSHAGGNWMKLASAISKIFRYISNYLNMWTLHFLTFFLHIFTWCLSTWALHALCVCSECALGWPHVSLNLQDPGDDGLSISLTWHILSFFWRPKSLQDLGVSISIFLCQVHLTFDVYQVPFLPELVDMSNIVLYKSTFEPLQAWMRSNSSWHPCHQEARKCIRTNLWQKCCSSQTKIDFVVLALIPLLTPLAVDSSKGLN